MLLAESFSSTALSWNPIDDINALLQYQFMQNAFIAGLIVAIMSAAIGWYATLRSEAYATHTLSLIGFPGAAGAALIGVQPLIGYFVFCVSGALTFPKLSRTSSGIRSESAAVASVQAFALALGVLFVSLYSGYANNIESYLFGTFLGITTGDVVLLGVVGICALLCLSVIRHRLLFASVDSATANASGISVRKIETIFLILLGLAIAETSQFTGALLAFTLTITPAAIAQLITPKPALAIWLAIGFGVSFAWLGLAIAYFTNYPVGVFITSLAFATYLIVHLIKKVRGR